MSGPRFFPSGNRLGPYFCRRFAASPASRPFCVWVARRFATSSTRMACQAATSFGVLAFDAVLMLMLRPLLKFASPPLSTEFNWCNFARIRFARVGHACGLAPTTFENRHVHSLQVRAEYPQP